MAAPIIATGVTITFATSAWSANLMSVTHSGNGREAIKTSYQGTTTVDTFVPSKLRDPGSWEIEVQYDPLEDPPLDAAAETITVAWPDGEEEAFTGFVTGFEKSGTLDEMVMATMTIKVSGAITSPTPTATA